MELTRFSVKNFRSITEANQINIGNVTTIVGKNNEGKSNIIKALNLAVNILKSYQSRILYGGRYRGDSEYYRERDFPIQMQESKRIIKKETTFKLSFLLSDGEIKEFKKRIQSYLNGEITIHITIGESNKPKIDIKKPGKFTKTTFGSQISKITEYISSKIDITYIPAIRTDDDAIKIVENMISLELGKIEDNPKYKEALNVISGLQKPILMDISRKVEESLKLFMPDVINVETNISEYQRRMSLRRDCEIFIDDGVKTKLEYKGDGVKSLVALSLLKDAPKENKFSLIAIEEPESHLHPGAIHTLRDTIYELSANNQVILSTHNPLFVNRDNVSSNIIVDSGKAIPAKKINTIRDILGIKQSDNLINATYVLIVEGEDDVISLKAILSNESEKIKKGLNDNIFVIEAIGGAGSLSYKLSLLRNSLCSYYVFLDHDSAGESAYNSAETSGYLTTRDITFSICNGMQDSEFEDCLDGNYYKQLLLEKFGVNIDVNEFHGNQKRSDRMKNVFLSQGKPRTDKVKRELKFFIAMEIAKNPGNVLNQHKRNSIDALKTAIENFIK